MQVTFKGLKWLNIIYICTHIRTIVYIHRCVCVYNQNNNKVYE